MTYPTIFNYKLPSRYQKIYLFLMLFILALQVYAKDESEDLLSYPQDHVFYKFKKDNGVEYSLSSPYHTIHTQIENLDEDSYHPEIAAKVFPNLDLSQNEKERLARKLKLIFFKNGIYLNVEDLPLEKDYIDPKTKTDRFFISPKLPNIYLEKQENGEWLYSVYSTQRINDLFDASYPAFISRIVLRFGSTKKFSKPFLGLKIWQWMTILLLSFISYCFYFLCFWGTNQFLKHFFHKLPKEDFKNMIFPKLRYPIAIIIISASWYYFTPFLLLSERLTFTIVTLSKIFCCLFLISLLYHIADLIVIKIGLYSNRRTNTMDINLLPILRVVFRISFVVTGILISLSFFGFDISHLVTGISFGGVALAFAAQDTVKNFFGSIMIFADKPFRVGDWVSINGQEGVVEEIGFRTTRIRTFANSLLNIPNGTMVNSNIDNIEKRQYRRYKTMLSLPYDTEPVKIQEFIDRIKKMVINNINFRQDVYEIRLNNFSAASLDVLLYVFFNTRSWDEELKLREKLMFDILNMAKEIGVEFAFPTQTLYLKNDNVEVSDITSFQKVNNQ